ncbi:MAG: glycoside hydrolase family 88 protein [Melioribacteraceae bacterium]|nr:glycoside hydrolase family 88 protein [Melioribacteraceae bacterium]
MKKRFMNFVLIIILSSTSLFYCQDRKNIIVDENLPMYVRLADSFLHRHPGAVTYDSIFTETKWNYEQGLILEALYRVYKYTGEKKYFQFIKENLDQYIEEDGKIKTYKFENFNIDLVNPGRALLYTYQETKNEKLKIAADTLRKQLKYQPRTPSGGLWHKKIYPNQMWLDGLYMGQPFNALYSVIYNQPENFDDIIHQFTLIEKNTRDYKTGLLYHAWDESREQKWADPETGRSPNFWGRAMGWYSMALVDVLEILPESYPEKVELKKILERLAEAIVKYRDKKTNIWYQVIDQGDREGNYLEASATSMFAYALAKGSNEGYIDKEYLKISEKVFTGLLENLIKIEDTGYINLYNICRSAGLGGTPYRDGSFEYYISEPKRMNDIKGYGPFILAALELDKAGYKFDTLKINSVN